MARPSKLTDELEDAICECVAKPMPLAHAAMRHGITERTVLRWMQYGDPAAQPAADWPKELDKYRRFRQAVERARGRASEKLIGVIEEAAIEGDWRAALALGERMFPRELAGRQKVEHTGADGGPIRQEQKHEARYDLSRLSVEELAQLEALQQKAAGELEAGGAGGG